MFSNNPVSQSMIDAVNKVLGEAPQAAAPAQPVEQPKNPFAPQLLDESDEKVNPEESKCVTEPKAKEIAKKEVKGHEKKLHQKEDMTFANKLKCSIKEGKATGTEEIFTDNNLGEEEMSDKQKAKREKIVMSMKGDEAGLKQRYGKNWKNVMYATATKQAMKEEVEDLEELDKSDALEKQRKDNVTKSMKAMGKNDRQIKYVHKKTDDVIKKAAGEKVKKEDVSEYELDEMINEVLSKDASAGDWIHDFVHSDNPKFAGKSKAERKKMALGAYYGTQKESYLPADTAITTDTLAGRMPGGKSNSFQSFKSRVKPLDKEGNGNPEKVLQQEPEETPSRASIKAKPTDNLAPQKVKNQDPKYGTANSFQEEVEFDEVLDEAVSRKDFQMVADLIKTHDHPGKRKELAQHHAEIFSKQNPRFDHAKFMKAAGVNEATIAGSSGWEPMKKDVKDKSGAVHTPMSRAKDLARQAFKTVSDKTKVKEQK